MLIGVSRMKTLTFGAFQGLSQGSNNGMGFLVGGAMLRGRLPDIGDVRWKAYRKSSLYRRERWHEVWLRQQPGFPDDAQHRTAKLAFA
jgi:hypothetical protein